MQGSFHARIFPKDWPLFHDCLSILGRPGGAAKSRPAFLLTLRQAQFVTETLQASEQKPMPNQWRGQKTSISGPFEGGRGTGIADWPPPSPSQLRHWMMKMPLLRAVDAAGDP
jgi:hypothetical protein